MKRLFSLSLISLTLFHFSAKAQQIDSTEFFNPDNFLGDTLYIRARFMECGEFGGHLEVSKIYLVANEFYITYQKFSADCNKIKENNGEPLQTLVKTVTKLMLNEDKALFRRYFHQLVDAKFREPTPSHAGYSFEIKKSDNSINLYIYTWGEITRIQYSAFIKQLIE